MQHDICLESFNLRLRPVRMGDASFIVWLRNLKYVKGNVGDSAADVASQQCWLKAYFEREGDYYFIVETSGGIPLGTHGIYDVNKTIAEKGRHILRQEVTVTAGLPNTIMLIDLAFERLGLNELRSTSVSTNHPVLSSHQRIGFKQVGITRAAQVIGGKSVDLVQFLLTAKDWLRIRVDLMPLAHWAGIQVLEWEKSQLDKTQPWMILDRS